MPEPTVVCVMLTKDRPEMAQRAVSAFRAQTYGRKRLLAVNNGRFALPDALLTVGSEVEIYRHNGGSPIGSLRNVANGCTACDIIAHWDDDDWSHPNRLAEQVALLQSSGAECVVYTDMLFWDTRFGHFCGAWLYTNPAPVFSLGSSMLYWRSAWEARPFDDINHGEDGRFMRKIKTVGVSSFPALPDCMIPQKVGGKAYLADPLRAFMDDPHLDLNSRMVCGIHGGNSSPYRPENSPNSYRRTPEWDDYCRKMMQL